MRSKSDKQQMTHERKSYYIPSSRTIIHKASYFLSSTLLCLLPLYSLLCCCLCSTRSLASLCAKLKHQFIQVDRDGDDTVSIETILSSLSFGGMLSKENNFNFKILSHPSKTHSDDLISVIRERGM